MNFRIEGRVCVSTWTDIEADSQEEALKLAEDRHMMMGFINNSGLDASQAWIIEEIDGVPYDLYIDD